MSEFIHHDVSPTCFGPHRAIIRSVLYKLYSQIWYVVIRVLLDTSSRYEVTKNAPDDGPVRSETCRANIVMNKLTH